MKKILVPTDFSGYSDYALALGIQLAKKMKASIKLIHIVEEPTSQTFNTIAMVGLNDMEKLFEEEILEKSREKLKKLLEKSTDGDIELDSQLIVCKPYDSISEIITKEETDLIVIGSKGRSGLDEIIVGSNAEKVVRLASCPVITVHSKVDLNDVKKMVFATKLPINNQIAGLANNFQQLLGTTIELLWIHTPHVIENEDKVMERFKLDIEKYEILNCNINIRKAYSIEEGILSFVEEMKADLILMATHGRKGLSHLLKGSYAEEIVNHSDRLVLTLSLNS